MSRPIPLCRIITGRSYPLANFSPMIFLSASCGNRDRSRPIIERTQPLGDVTVNNNNVVVNNNLTVNYVEEKTEQKVVTRRIDRGTDPKGGSKVEANAVEIFQPAAEEKPKDVAPPKPKKIEEVAKQSQTKAQAGGEAATDEMLVPAEIKKATGETEAKPAAGEAAKQGEPATTPLPAKPLASSLPAGKEVSAPPPAGGAPAGEPIPAEQGRRRQRKRRRLRRGQQVPSPAQGKEALPPPPSEGAAPPPAEDGGAPAGTKEGGPKLKNGKADKSKQGEPQSMEPKAPPPPPPVEEPAPPPPPIDEVAPPPPPLPPAGKAAPQLSPPPAGEAAPPPTAACRAASGGLGGAQGEEAGQAAGRIPLDPGTTTASRRRRWATQGKEQGQAQAGRGGSAGGSSLYGTAFVRTTSTSGRWERP